MSPMTVVGPYYVNLGTPGLAPGQSQGTHWLGWVPEPRQFAATVTAHPGTVIPGPGTVHKPTRLAVTDTSVEYVPEVSGPAVTTKLIIHATVTNRGSNAVKDFTIVISFLTK